MGEHPESDEQGAQQTEAVDTAAPVKPAAAPQSTWSRLRLKWWFRWGTDGLLMVAIIWAVLAWQGRNLLDTREPAPAFQLTSMDGKTVALEDLKGKQVVLAFWAPWCTVCAAESSTISSLHQSVGDDVVVMSVALGYDNRAQVQAWMTEHAVDYPVLLGDPSMAETWHIDKFPTVYVLDEEGAIKGATVGYSTEWGLRARLL